MQCLHESFKLNPFIRLVFVSTIKLAIVVPTRNSSALIPRLLNSLNKQTFQDFRVIFVDASTKRSEQEFLDKLVYENTRYSWVPQKSEDIGIYGAMNNGFRLLRPSEWVLFWGSDDWASSSTSLFDAITSPVLQDADLVVCKGRYIRLDSTGVMKLVRSASFRWFFTYRLSLYFGSTPPHQCTIIGPGARDFRDFYNDKFAIAADLDFFLSLSEHKSCRVRKISVELVDISVGGISGVQHRSRLNEVIRIYRNSFGFPFFALPFFMRYFQRLFSLIPLKSFLA